MVKAHILAKGVGRQGTTTFKARGVLILLHKIFNKCFLIIKLVT